MSHQEQIISFLKANEKRMFTLLEEMVLIQSGSWNKKGVDKVNELICSHLTPHQFSFEVHEQKEFGNHLVVRSPSFSPDVPQILLTGHMDTVFPVDTDFNFYKENQNRCFGPGVADMKGGLVVGIYALLALQDTGLLSQMPVTFIFNSDEEIGSRTSRKLILSEAKKSCAGFVFESGGLDNSVVSGRKGNISATLTIEGEDGHAAFAVKNKASAILELAQKTIEIENLNDPDAGISSNVGKIKGGIGPNTVAQHAKAQLDFRFVASKDNARLEKKIKEICANTLTPGTSSNLEIVSHRPPMPETKENTDLFLKMVLVAQNLGMKIVPQIRNGVSDANIIALAGIPVLDGLGPVGSKDHSKDEYIEKASLLERTILFACFLANS